MSKSVCYKNYLEYNAYSVVSTLVKELHDSYEASRLYEKTLERELKQEKPNEELIASCKVLIESYKQTATALTCALLKAGVSPYDN